MFKVECLGCQAPYQVDERRVPEKGLKMRCPKCGTSFKVDPPVKSAPETTASSVTSTEEVGLPAPVPSPFGSFGIEPGRKLGKAPSGGRDPMARTMIGVSAADLDLLTKAPKSEEVKPKGFRIPRPNAPPVSESDPELRAELSAGAIPSPPPARGFELAPHTGTDDEEAALPVALGEARRGASFVDVGETREILPSAAPASDPSWLTPLASEPPPESLAEPISPLRLSELPQPITASRPSTRSTGDRLADEPSAPESAKLELRDDLPVVAGPSVRRPPPRRARPPQPEVKAEPAETVDLPARLEDLDVSVPTAVSPPGHGVEARRAPPPKPTSSLDELDLPTIAGAREAKIIGLPAPLAASAKRTAVDLPSVAARHEPAPRGLSDADLPSVGRGEPAPMDARLPPTFSDLPDVFAAGLPAIAAAGLPDVVSAGLPELSGAGLPDVLATGLPALSDVSLPEVSGRGVVGFGRVDLPVAREAGLPEVRAGNASVVEMDLPGIGEALPSLAYGGSWDEGNLPLVGESLPAAKSRADAPPRDGSPSGEARPFVDFGPDAEGDPFGADFGANSADPFAPESGAGLGSADAELDLADGDLEAGAFGAAARPAGAGYGEVDVGGDSYAEEASFETADDMEFSAVPQRSSGPPARPAASATVHDAADAEATGSTLELGPERKGRRGRTRSLAVVAMLCATAIGGGALALKPALGPFGIHFILDQVKRGEHERLLARLMVEGRRSVELDTLDSARLALAALEAARPLAPRFEPLAARTAIVNYHAALRFGPLPKLEAAGKAAIEQLDKESAALGNRLARAAHQAAALSPDARRDLEALSDDPEAREILGELLLRLRDWPAAATLWTELGKAQPDSPRSAFGLARAQLGLGQPAAAQAQARRVLELNPEHVGAPILLLEAHRALQSASDKSAPEVGRSEELVAAVKRVLPRAAPGEAARAHSVLGELHLSQGRHGPAQQAFEEALAVDRNFPRALIGLGEMLHISGRHTEALARFEVAARAEPDSLHAQVGIAKSQIQLAHLPEAQALLTRLAETHKGHPEVIFWTGKAHQALRAHDAALASYRAAIDAGQGRADSVTSYLALASLQSELGQLAVAQQTLSEAQEKLPPSGPLHKALGEIAMNRAEYARAYADFEKALALDSGDTRARFMGAVALTRLGRFDEALAAFQTVGETDKDFPGLAVERGRLFEESGRNEEALREYEAAFLKSPDDIDLQIRVGCGRVIAGRSDAAEKILEEVLKASPRSAEAYYCLGRALFEQERYVDASTRLDRALNLDSTRAVYHLYAGWVAGEVGRHGDAETALDNALELDKGLADAYWQRGRLRLKQGAVKDAIRDLEHALELKPSRYEALADLAVAFADGGRMPQALRKWEEAIAKDADNPTWHFRYGKLLSSAGHGAQAAAHLKRAVDLVNEAPATKSKPPIWLWQAHYLLGRELGRVQAAVPHWQAYLRHSPADDPYRPEAERALAALGQPWEQR